MNAVKTCPCGVVFTYATKGGNERKYCSDACRKAGIKRMTKKAKIRRILAKEASAERDAARKRPGRTQGAGE